MIVVYKKYHLSNIIEGVAYYARYIWWGMVYPLTRSSISCTSEVGKWVITNIQLDHVHWRGHHTWSALNPKKLKNKIKILCVGVGETSWCCV